MEPEEIINKIRTIIDKASDDPKSIHINKPKQVTGRIFLMKMERLLGTAIYNFKWTQEKTFSRTEKDISPIKKLHVLYISETRLHEAFNDRMIEENLDTLPENSFNRLIKMIMKGKEWYYDPYDRYCSKNPYYLMMKKEIYNLYRVDFIGS